MTTRPFKTKLSNGLTMILQETHQAPVVSLNLWANVGSVNETDQEAGLCHLIEHMIFKGTGRRPVGEIARSVEAAGGDMNAYTSFDETVFYINMPARTLDLGLDILADAASDPTFDATELAREKEVVVEEISRAEDNPSQMASEDLFTRAFTVHPYRRPIAGNRETVRGVSREYLLEFFRRWYVGSNLILVCAGDFRVDEVMPKIEKLFSKIPPGKPPLSEIPDEPIQKEARSITRGMPVEGHYLDCGFPIPALKHPDVPGLDVLAHILGGGASGRLEQVLREKKGLVTSIGCYAYTPRYPSLFIVGACLKGGRLNETTTALWGEIERIQSEPPTPVELARARENIRSARIYERQTAQGLARKLCFFEGIAGDLAFEEEYYRRISEVTAENVQELARKYLLQKRVTLSFCHPATEKWDEQRVLSAGGSCRGEKRLLPQRGPSAFLPPPPAPITDIRTSPQTRRFRLSNGIRLLVRENHAVPLISIKSASLGGIRFETRQTNGLSHLTAALLTKGTAHRGAREIAEETDSLSGHIEDTVGRNLIGLQGTFLAEKLTQGLNLFCDILRFPSFPEEEIRKERSQTLTEIRMEEDSLPSLAMKRFLAKLYPNHPYGLPVLGTPRSLRQMTRARIIRNYQETVRPDNLTIVVVGDVDAREIYERLKEKFSSWKGPKRKFSLPSIPMAPAKPIIVETRRKKFQAHIVYGFLGTTVRNKDRFPLEVLNCTLAGQGGRLFLELRDKQGLAYAISSSTQEGIEPGTFAVYMGTDPAKLEVSIDGIRKELAKVVREGVTEVELERAKRYIIGNFEIELQKNSAVAGFLTTSEIYGLGPQELERYPKEIEAVTTADVLRVARKYIRPEASVLSIVRP